MWIVALQLIRSLQNEYASPRAAVVHTVSEITLKQKQFSDISFLSIEYICRNFGYAYALWGVSRASRIPLLNNFVKNTLKALFIVFTGK